MQNHFLDVEAAWAQVVTSTSPECAIDYPNFELEEKPAGEIWLQINNLRGETTLATLGDLGTNQNKGILQIDVNAPKGSGSKNVLEKAGFLTNLFPVGHKLIYNDIIITVNKQHLSQGRYVGNDYRVSLSLYYSYRTPRN